jgi:hypothetical protein
MTKEREEIINKTINNKVMMCGIKYLDEVDFFLLKFIRIYIKFPIYTTPIYNHRKKSIIT